MSNNKKRAAATAAAVALGALLVLGGASMAWLQDSTEVTTNEFATNSNDVDLSESNTEFDIVPGTSEEKDPTVTATYTLDSYVYVVVYDNTQGLVEWEMDSSWTLLTYENGDPVTYKGGTVYYQTLTYDGDGESADSFSDTVIAGSTVSYSSSLTNEDMDVEDDVTLAFQAFIMQAEVATGVTASAVNAWWIMLGSEGSSEVPDGYTVNESTGEVYAEFSDAVSAASAGDTVQLLADSEETTITLRKSVTIDLNGNTLDIENSGSSTQGIYLRDSSAVLTIEDTSEDGSGVITSSDLTETVYVQSGTVELKSGTISNTASSGKALYAMSNGTFIMSGEDAVIDCENTGAYCVYANSGTFIMSAGTLKNAADTCVYLNGYAECIISGGTISTTTGTCIYVQGYSSLTIKNNPQIINSYTSGYCLRVNGTYATVNIAGGTFIAEGNNGYTVYVLNASVGAKLNITGGTFNPSLSSYAQNGIAEGYELVDNDDGSYSVVESVS